MTDSLGRQALAFREETVRMPMRGQVATPPVLYFPQEPVVTNAETGAGWAQSQSVKLKNIFNDYTDKYSFIIRFRLDAGLPLNRDWSWILNMGYGSSGGFMLGLNGNAQNRQLRLFSSKTSFELFDIPSGTMMLIR